MQPFSSRKLAFLRCMRIAAILLSAALLSILFRQVAADVFIIIFGASLIAFVTEPAARIFERKFSRSTAAFFAIGTCFLAAALLICFLLPSLVREIRQLADALPRSIELIRSAIGRWAGWLESHTGLTIPGNILGNRLPEIARGTIVFAGSLADIFYRASLMIVLGYFFLCDRSRLVIRMELLVPSSIRCTAVRMGNAVSRELKLYLRGQGLIAAIVGVLSALGLFIAGVPAALVLGLIIGLLNMIPYFGPIIGSIPAILMALTVNVQTALLAAGILWIIQQIDSTLISPRIMSGLTGLSPAAVLLAIFAGSGLGGIAGMLFAMPVVLTIRTAFRVFVQRYENV